jgi:hypothetical protein
MKAAKEVLVKTSSLQKASAKYSKKFMTLQRFCKKLEAGSGIKCYEFILAASKLYHGLNMKNVRNLAYQYVVKNNVTIPAGWCDEQHASSDWLSSFLKRKSKLSIRTPQATSLGRATSFNKHNVEMFFANLGKLYDKYNFQC